MEDILFRTALQLNIPDVLDWCSTSKQYHAICSLPEFWKAYCEYHFYFNYNTGTKELAKLMYNGLRKLHTVCYVSALWLNVFSKIIVKENMTKQQINEIFTKLYDIYKDRVTEIRSNDPDNEEDITIIEHPKNLSNVLHLLRVIYGNKPEFITVLEGVVLPQLAMPERPIDIALLTSDGYSVEKEQESVRLQNYIHQPCIYVTHLGSIVLPYNVDAAEIFWYGVLISAGQLKNYVPNLIEIMEVRQETLGELQQDVLNILHEEEDIVSNEITAFLEQRKEIDDAKAHQMILRKYLSRLSKYRENTDEI